MDKQSFSIQVKRMERQLYRVAMSYVANETDAADAVQEALLRAWAARNSLRDETLFGTWLTRILINECKTLLRKRRRSIPVAEPEGTAELPDEDRTAHDELFRLPVKYRVPLVLNVLDGYTMREIAGILHLPQGTVKARISRAKQQLRTILKEVADDEE